MSFGVSLFVKHARKCFVVAQVKGLGGVDRSHSGNRRLMWLVISLTVFIVLGRNRRGQARVVGNRLVQFKILCNG